ncbi:hypothetical protein [Tardiphaga sp.]|uniref:hypothetical protein n=1 Tax=Tardiphaga sp. TaxID=1926292 RepID=UPI002604378A|nr:hypothetical protein [Tardiphaga sp.]MDB5620553.1 hypothetical protein [Tardiphaga sp.]
MAEHTPTPWKWTEGTAAITREWFGADRTIVAVKGRLAWHEDDLCSSREAGANADLIVRAVNAHETLVAALATIAQFPITDASNMDAVNMKLLAQGALNSSGVLVAGKGEV